MRSTCRRQVVRRGPIPIPNYRRFFVPGGTLFLTIATYERSPFFADEINVERLRQAFAQVKRERPFDFVAAVILPDHLHVLWTLPRGDTAYSVRVGRIKVLFTRALRGHNALPQDVSASRQKHRESNVWHRRFWEHTIADDRDFEQHLNYIHYNPVKHGHARCPHSWPHSSFARSVADGLYDPHWGCSCDGRIPAMPRMASLDGVAGE
jgi:putative transposase